MHKRNMIGRPLLVEKRTVQHMCSVRDGLQRKSNGENMIRIVLLSVIFFIMFQMFSKSHEHPTTASSAQRARTPGDT